MTGDQARTTARVRLLSPNGTTTNYRCVVYQQDHDNTVDSSSPQGWPSPQVSQ
jgi:hypothetical protein